MLDLKKTLTGTACALALVIATGCASQKSTDYAEEAAPAPREQAATPAAKPKPTQTQPAYQAPAQPEYRAPAAASVPQPSFTPDPDQGPTTGQLPVITSGPAGQ